MSLKNHLIKTIKVVALDNTEFTIKLYSRNSLFYRVASGGYIVEYSTAISEADVNDLVSKYQNENGLEKIQKIKDRFADFKQKRDKLREQADKMAKEYQKQMQEKRDRYNALSDEEKAEIAEKTRLHNIETKRIIRNYNARCRYAKKNGLAMPVFQ